MTTDISGGNAGQTPKERFDIASIPRSLPAVPPPGSGDDPRLGGRVITSDVENVDVHIVGCPDDTGIRNVGGRTGASEGPPTLRHWLFRQTTGMNGELARIRIHDLGDVLPGRDIEETHDRLERMVAGHAHDAPVVLIGGGHDLAYASQSGILQGREGTMAVLNLDAHLDVRPLRDGTVVTSGTPFRRLLERWPDRLERLVELGIQPQHNSALHFEWARAHGVEVHTLDSLREGPGIAARLKQVLDEAASAADLVTVSVDLDAFASAYAPGVSAPPADGFRPEDVLPFIEYAGRNPRVQLLDVVELSPENDVDDRTARLAALVIWRFLAGVAAR